MTMPMCVMKSMGKMVGGSSSRRMTTSLLFSSPSRASLSFFAVRRPSSRHGDLRRRSDGQGGGLNSSSSNSARVSSCVPHRTWFSSGSSSSLLSSSSSSSSIVLGRRASPLLITAASQRWASALSRTEVEDRILELLKAFNKIDSTKVTRTAHFRDDLGLDSLDTVDVVMTIEEEFSIEIPDAAADKIQSVAQAIDYIASREDAY